GARAGTLLALFCALTGAASASPGADKVVHYHGYRLAVPSSWPVFDLSSDPSACVRFNRHAVYLGQPSPEQRCPAHAVGRTESILVQPLSGRAAGSAHPLAPALPPVGNGAGVAPRASSAHLVMTSAGVAVTATWASHPRVVQRALGTRLPPGARAEAPRGV